MPPPQEEAPESAPEAPPVTQDMPEDHPTSQRQVMAILAYQRLLVMSACV